MSYYKDMWEMILPYLLLIFIPIFGDCKSFVQNILFKKRKLSSKDYSLFLGLMLTLGGIIIGAIFVREIPSKMTFIYAAIFGVLSIGFQILYNKALQTGSVALTGVISQFCIILPIIYGFIFLKEQISALKIISIVLILASFVFLNTKSDGKKPSKLWVFFLLTSLLCAGFSKITQSYFTSTEYSNEIYAFLTFSNLVAGPGCIIISLCEKPKEKYTIKLDKVVIPCLIATAIIVGFYNMLVMVGLTMIDTTIFFPVTSAIGIITFVLYGAIFNKEKFKTKQIVGIILGLAGSILINIV